ncbi:hypothetical protein ANCCEY_03496 [Ancylostoma ceylanicum]|uniref:Uncharacterized protein n=1 Tax=Ancylostoma ceylanicum TaxID=53326 RepID=A0A0D6M1S5_9BILA|nr:hypothetical protein ANCCEY_03496 [Ancylostoma ceylanicum]
MRQITKILSFDEHLTKPLRIGRVLETSDLSLFGSSLPHFVSPDEARQFACDCGDPLISRAACARRGNEVPTCHEIPDLCMREYSILFTETGDRLAQPLTTRATTTTTEPPTTTTEFVTTIRVPPPPQPLPPQRRQPFFRKFQRQPATTRRPLRREFVFRNRVPTRRPLRRQKTFQLRLLDDRFDPENDHDLFHVSCHPRASAHRSDSRNSRDPGGSR